MIKYRFVRGNEMSTDNSQANGSPEQKENPRQGTKALG